MAGRNPLARLTTERDRHGLSLPRGERVLAAEQMAGTGDVKPHRAGSVGRLGREAPVLAVGAQSMRPSTEASS